MQFKESFGMGRDIATIKDGVEEMFDRQRMICLFFFLKATAEIREITWRMEA